MMSGGQPEYRGNAAQSEAVVTGICASYTASVAARNTLTGTEIRRGRHASDSAQITCPGSGIRASDTASVVAHNTLTASGTGGGRHARDSVRTGEFQLFLSRSLNNSPSIGLRI